LGWLQFLIYRVPNPYGTTNSIRIENNYIHGTCWYPENSGTLGPQAICSNDGYSFGHEARYNVIDLANNEGIGAGGMAVVEYNLISNCDNPAIYFDASSSNDTKTCDIRYNLVWGDADSKHGSGEIRIDDEKLAGINTGISINIYGNIVTGGYAGVGIRNMADNSNFKAVRVYNNTLIDNKYNIYVSRSQEFNLGDIRNNAFIINSDASSYSKHLAAWSCTDYSGWQIGPNFYYGDGYTSESNLPAEWRAGVNVFGSIPPLLKSSGWRVVTSLESFSFNDFIPKAESEMSNNLNLSKIIGFETLLTSGSDFKTLPNITKIYTVTEGVSAVSANWGAISKAGDNQQSQMGPLAPEGVSVVN
jgi:hypothetical protein